jgi:hypothetical protein
MFFFNIQAKYWLIVSLLIILFSYGIHIDYIISIAIGVVLVDHGRYYYTMPSDNIIQIIDNIFERIPLCHTLGYIRHTSIEKSGIPSDNPPSIEKLTNFKAKTPNTTLSPEEDASYACINIDEEVR